MDAFLSLDRSVTREHVPQPLFHIATASDQLEILLGKVERLHAEWSRLYGSLSKLKTTVFQNFLSKLTGWKNRIIAGKD